MSNLFPLSLLLGFLAKSAIIPAAFGIFLVIAAFFVGNAHQRNVAAKLFGFLVLVFVSALLGVFASNAFLDTNRHQGDWGVGVDVVFIVCEIAVLLTFLATLYTVVVIFCCRPPDGDENNDD